MGIHIHVSRSIMLLLLIVSHIGVSNAQLSESFYNSTCPNVVSIIQRSIDFTVFSDSRMRASLLRLHYSDCFVNGCDASVLLDDTADFIGEKTATVNNNSLRGFDMIDELKEILEIRCPGVVSCADILAIAARESVFLSGGPRWKLKLGRRDSTRASLSDANAQLPSHEMNYTTLFSAFRDKGSDLQFYMTALIGGHTIGMARCITARNRIYNGTLPTDPRYLTWLKSQCPASGGDENLLALDAAGTSIYDTMLWPGNSGEIMFDSSFFNSVYSQRALLYSDQQFYLGDYHMLQRYNSFPQLFFKDFAQGMIRMSELSPLTGTNGQIRRNCRRINSD